MNKWLWGFAFSLLLLCSCQHLDFSNEKDNKDGNVPDRQMIIPKRTGLGTQEAPYTVTDVIEGKDTLMGRMVWVVAYGVGETYKSLGNANFLPPFLYSTSLLLADDSLCQHTSEVLPAELSTAALKRDVALSNVPQYHRQCLILQATVQTYYNTTGLRSIKNYYWLPKGFVIPTSRPEEWDVLPQEWLKNY